jgi:hypothetical protein
MRVIYGKKVLGTTCTELLRWLLRHPQRLPVPGA